MTFSPAVHLPRYNGLRGTVAAPRLASRQATFSYNDSPPQVAKSQSRPATTPLVTGKVKNGVFTLLFGQAKRKKNEVITVCFLYLFTKLGKR